MCDEVVLYLEAYANCHLVDCINQPILSFSARDDF
jgi:hypothetical protein